MRASSLVAAIALTSVVLGCTACTVNSGTGSGGGELSILAGSGNEVREERNVPAGFTGVDSAWSENVIVTSGKPQRVTIIGDDNVVPKVRTEPYGHVLKISLPGKFSNISARAEVDMPEMTSAAATGSGTMEIRDVDTKDFELSLDGSGNVTITGECKNLEVILTGSGNVDASALKCIAASVLLQGSGNAKVAPKKELHAAISGSGNIVCMGKPASVTEAVKGSGRLEYK